ncbi:hypothetical protein AAVH_16789 [Aphelenchoides avenae]|nr:hypothetical protein AAVH_16789 [Aphelenchus avenae]
MQFRFRLDAIIESFKRLLPRQQPTKANKFCRPMNYTARLEEVSSTIRQRVKERCAALEQSSRPKRFLHGVWTVFSGIVHLTSIVWEAGVLSQELVHEAAQPVPHQELRTSPEDSNETEGVHACWLQLLAEAQIQHRLQERLKLIDDITAEGFVSEGTTKSLLEAIVGYSRPPTAVTGMMLVTELTRVVPRKCTVDGDIYVDVVAKYEAPKHVATLVKTVDYGRYNDDRTRFERFDSAWMRSNGSYYEIDQSNCEMRNAIFFCKGPKLIVSSCILDGSVNNCHPSVYNASSGVFLLHENHDGKHTIATKLQSFWIDSAHGRHRFSTPESGIFEVTLPAGYALILGTSVQAPKMTLDGTEDVVIRITEVKWVSRA